MSDDAKAPDPILAKDTGRRLDAIVSRHSGRPKPVASSRVVLPAPPRGKRKGQLSFDDVEQLEDGNDE